MTLSKEHESLLKLSNDYGERLELEVNRRDVGTYYLWQDDGALIILTKLDLLALHRAITKELAREEKL